MKCYYCGKEAVGMKASGYYDTSATSFRFLCKKCWKKVRTNYNNEINGDFDEQ